MKRVLGLVLGAFIFSLTLVAPVSAAKQSNAVAPKNLIGYDIAWPQCGKKLPTDQAFGVVNVNGGLANNTSPCLAEQLRWATRSSGGTNQPKVQLYVNTANPGGLNTPSWPKNNVDPAGNIAPNPGTCDGSDSVACAWQYGWNRAVEDVIQRFAPTASAAGISSNTGDYTWWLDVETENTWKLSGTQFDYASNTADLEGMTAYFKSKSAKVGLYSTAAQWSQIVGPSVGASSNLNGLDNWRPSGASLSNAKANCSVAPLTSGGRISLTQFVVRSLDNDYSCI